MKIKDVFDEIRNQDFTDDNRLWFEGIDLKMFNPNKRLAFNPEIIEEKDLDNFQYKELEIDDYYYRVDEEYINFVVVKCSVLLKEVLL